MRAPHWRIGHQPGGRVLVRIDLLRIPRVGRFGLRVALSPANARTVAGALTRQAALAEVPRG